MRSSLSSRESTDVRLEALEIEEVVDHTESVDSIDVMLSESENGEAMVNLMLVAAVEHGQHGVEFCVKEFERRSKCSMCCRSFSS